MYFALGKKSVFIYFQGVFTPSKLTEYICTSSCWYMYNIPVLLLADMCTIYLYFFLLICVQYTCTSFCWATPSYAAYPTNLLTKVHWGNKASMFVKYVYVMSYHKRLIEWTDYENRQTSKEQKKKCQDFCWKVHHPAQFLFCVQTLHMKLHK